MRKIEYPKEVLRKKGHSNYAGETDKYYVLLELEYLRLVSKNEFRIKQSIYLGKNHPMGYRPVICHNNFICTVVYSKPHLDSTIFGNPKYAELRTYKNGGLIWKRELHNWTITNNFGGIHLLNQKLVVFEGVTKQKSKQEMGYSTPSIIEFESGKTIHKLKTSYIGSSQTLGSRSAICIKKRLFLEEEYGLKSISIQNNILQVIQVTKEQVYRMTANEDYLFLFHIRGMDLFFKKYDLDSLNLISEELLKFDFDFDRAIINSNSKHLVLNNTNKNLIAGYDLVEKKIIWEKEIAPGISSTTIKFISESEFIYFAGIIGGSYGLINVITGNEIARYTHTSSSNFPSQMEIKDNYLFIDFPNYFSRTNLEELI